LCRGTGARRLFSGRDVRGYLFEHGTRPEFATRFRWTPGSIAFWDNRQVWHFAGNDYQGRRRVTNRILLAGTKPVPAV
jgi:taurine dioxygenase